MPCICATMEQPQQVEMTVWDVQEDSVPLNISAHTKCGGVWKFYLARDKEGHRAESKGPTLGGHCERPSDQVEDVVDAQGIYKASKD